MQKKSFEEISGIYDLQIDKVVNLISKQKAKKVLLQFPDGMKPYSTEISKEIEKRAGCNCFIWLDSCFGACDVPLEVEKLGIDLIIQFGHSSWNYKIGNLKVLK
jgi:2-(3-amino-3-carboxypropyl)histidine synthase